MRKIFYLLFLLSISTKTTAVIINYDEALDGDLIHGLRYDLLHNIGEMKAGQHTVKGTISRSGADGADTFNFYIANGYRLTSVVFTYNEVYGYSGMGNFLRQIDEAFLNTVIFNQEQYVDYRLGLMEIDSFSNVLPARAGQYQITTGGNAGLPSLTADSFLSYQWQINVERVNEPSILALIIIGLFAFRFSTKFRIAKLIV